MFDELSQKELIELAKVLAKGISMERNARLFYGGMAIRTESPDGRRMYEWLANFENGHEAKLKDKLDEILKHPSMKGYKLPASDEEPGFSEARSGDADPSPIRSDGEVLMEAIGNEQKAVAFYRRKFSGAVSRSVKDMFESMARDEERHIKILTEMHRHLQIEGIWGDFQAI
jgi:rubrerythrin